MMSGNSLRPLAWSCDIICPANHAGRLTQPPSRGRDADGIRKSREHALRSQPLQSDRQPAACPGDQTSTAATDQLPSAAPKIVDQQRGHGPLLPATTMSPTLSASLHQNGRDRTTALVKLGFDDHASWVRSGLPWIKSSAWRSSQQLVQVQLLGRNLYVQNSPPRDPRTLRAGEAGCEPSAGQPTAYRSC